MHRNVPPFPPSACFHAMRTVTQGPRLPCVERLAQYRQHCPSLSVFSIRRGKPSFILPISRISSLLPSSLNPPGLPPAEELSLAHPVHSLDSVPSHSFPSQDILSVARFVQLNPALLSLTNLIRPPQTPLPIQQTTSQSSYRNNRKNEVCHHSSSHELPSLILTSIPKCRPTYQLRLRHL